MAKKDEVKFVRVRGRVIPIRKRVSKGLETAGALTGTAAAASVVAGKVIAHRKLGKFRAKVSLSMATNRLLGHRPSKRLKVKAAQAFLKSPFKFHTAGVKLAAVSAFLGTASFFIAPDSITEEIFRGK